MTSKKTSSCSCNEISFYIIYNDYLIEEISNSFFHIFDFYKSKDDFIKSHNCISRLFVNNMKSKIYLHNLENKEWYINLLMSDNNGKKRVLFKIQNSEYHFVVTVMRSDYKSNRFIIHFTNITKTIQKEKKLLNIIEKKSIHLRKNRKILKHRDKLSLMGEMLENITHQWRQPLSNISSQTSSLQVQFLLETLTDDYLNQSLDSIIRSVDYMSQTINDFKSFLSEEKQKRVFNIEEILNKTLLILKGNTKDNSVEIITKIENNSYIIGFENEFMQSIINILNNSIDVLKSNSPSNRKIFINLSLHEDNMVLIIEDNGGGIPSEVISKIFEHYFTTKGERGSGIGLYMTKQIIENHFNGKILVSNTKNGASFTIIIPCYKFSKEE